MLMRELLHSGRLADLTVRVAPFDLMDYLDVCLANKRWINGAYT